MDKYFRERNFDYEISAGVIVSGVVSGRVLPKENGKQEIDDLKIDARVFTSEHGEFGVALDEYALTNEAKLLLEEFVISILCDDEEAA